MTKTCLLHYRAKVSPRFIINCHDSRTVFKANDVLEFEVIAIGNLAELFIHYIYAFERQKGLDLKRRCMSYYPF